MIEMKIRIQPEKYVVFLAVVIAGFFILTFNGKILAQEKQGGSTVILETTQGNVALKLYPDVAPKACENFIGLVKKGYYDGIIFHRVIKKFMIQGGDPTGTGMGGESIWRKPFADEVSGKMSFDRKGLLAMANAGPNTNGSQFFITTVATPWLNMHHTIFGEVISGYETVEKIENVSVDQSSSRPLEDQKIIRAYLKE